MSTREPVASCEGLERTYYAESGAVAALRGVACAVAGGSVTAIAGPSGSGKSTLLRILAALDRPDRGTVSVAGVHLIGLSARRRRRLRRECIGVVFARPSDNLVPYLTAAEHVHLAAGIRSVRVDAVALLDRLGLADRAGHRPAELSGGEQQRLALAAAITGSPALVLADEPTAELDRASAEQVVAALRSLADSGVALAVATHDRIVVDAADHVVRLLDGEVVA